MFRSDGRWYERYCRWVCTTRAGRIFDEAFTHLSTAVLTIIGAVIGCVITLKILSIVK